MNPSRHRNVSQQMTRRDFLAATSAALAAPMATRADAVPTLLDLHQHTNYEGRTDEQLIAHQAYHDVTTTVLLPGDGWMLSQLGDNASCAAMQANYPHLFVRFACSDVAESLTPDVLRGNIHRGAIGFGELKFHVAVDSPEMHRVYKLAEELGVPVLIHFQFEIYNTGIERFENVLKAYPKVNFFAHAQTWWGNISADLDPTDFYPKGPIKPGGLSDRLLSDYPNVFGDLSASSGANALTRDPDFTRGFLQRHSHKLIWGSDCECRNGRGEGRKDKTCIATRSLTALKEYCPDDATYRRITYENGAALLKLKP
jgi:uncharacterized protein